ncbi:MAG: hypothetical protein H7Z75_00395 [Ferruginibacter sp.]|nr:hypothetical protein [Cytophagales bacterium]
MLTLTSKLVAATQSGKVEYLPEGQTVILTFKGKFVPLPAFQNLLACVTALSRKEPVTKMIFDKSSLKVFHQPSMEWYHVEWKPEMLQRGLRVYRKILPQDALFVQSVAIGREKIMKNNPAFDLKQFDIQYCHDLEEALRS